jgi:hypothetical protein
VAFASLNFAPQINSITDSAGNVYTEAGNAWAVDTAGNYMVDLWYAKGSKSGASTVTITPSATGSGAAMIWELSNVDTVAPLDQTIVLSNQAATTTPVGGPVTTAASNEVVISVMSPIGSLTGLHAGNPFTNDSLLFGVGWGHLITSSAGTYTAQWDTASGTYASSTVSFKAATTSSTSACDLAAPYGTIDSADVNAAINMSLGTTPCTANIAGAGVCNVVVVQRVINAMPPPSGTGTCLTGTGAVAHSVSLGWTASTTTNVTYNVYRATASGAYSSTPIASSLAGTSYTDTTVQAGQTYFYVTKAVDSSGSLSVASNEAQATVPST